MYRDYMDLMDLIDLMAPTKLTIDGAIDEN